MDVDEGPSAADLDRFGGDTGYCPACGAEVYDQAEFCPECGEHLGGAVKSRPPMEDWFRQRWIALVVVLVVLGLLAWLVL